MTVPRYEFMIYNVLLEVLYRYIVATVVCTCTVPRTPLARQNAYLYIPVAAPSAGHYEFRLLFIDIMCICM